MKKRRGNFLSVFLSCRKRPCHSQGRRDAEICNPLMLEMPGVFLFLGMNFVEYAQENQMHDGCRTAYYTKRDRIPRGKCCAGDEKHYHLLTECGTISYQTITCSTRPGGCGAKRRMAMKCPYCGYQESKVVDSRPADEGSIRRRRECLRCERRFTTYETVESLPMVVIKKDGSRQTFDRSKVLRGIQRSCEKRPVPVADMERMATEIEQELQNNLEREISTELVGEMVMDKLKKADEVAYVRFASVYRQFKDINTFMGELNKLLSEK